VTPITAAYPVSRSNITVAAQSTEAAEVPP
jgi:hypothetical protein